MWHDVHPEMHQSGSDGVRELMVLFRDVCGGMVLMTLNVTINSLTSSELGTVMLVRS